MPIPKPQGREYSAAQKLVLAAVRAWTLSRPDDDARFPHGVAARELIPSQVDLEATLKPVPVMDRAHSTRAGADVCEKQIATEEVLEDERRRSALPMRGVIRAPPGKASRGQACGVGTPGVSERVFHFQERVIHRASLPRVSLRGHHHH